jgi:ABC-type uncharacterized transport system substrate-binding protein
MKFTKQEKLYEIGEKIFPTDMSALHRKDGMLCDSFDVSDIRDKIRKGHPFVVVSEPYEKFNVGWFDHEYYIDVKFKDSDVVYCIFNSKCNVFKDYWKMLEFVADCEECFALGY